VISAAQFDAYTGRPVVPGVSPALSPAVALGLEPPRFCVECGRRMVVQVVPDGWTAECSRHGVTDSTLLGRR
jgi:hypothetical protein